MEVILLYFFINLYFGLSFLSLITGLGSKESTLCANWQNQDNYKKMKICESVLVISQTEST